MKKQLLLFVMTLLPMVANAETMGENVYHFVEIDGITYSLYLETKEAVVSNNLQYQYKGNVIIPENVTYEGDVYSVKGIGLYAFSGCFDLTSVTIGNNVTTIEPYAFDYCKGLRSVTFGNSVKTIGESAFVSCASLTSVTIGENVETIGDGAFNSCEKLYSVVVPNSVKSIGYYAFQFCTSLTSVTLGNRLEKICNDAFLGCESLRSIIIPKSVKTIGNHAFGNCKRLSKIVLGSSVQEIFDHAFSNCQNLEHIYCYAEDVPDASDNSFVSSVYDEAVLHVPAGSIEKYKNKSPWNEFKKIKALTGSDPSDIEGTIVNSATDVTSCFTIDGRKSAHTPCGITIIRMSDGSIKKVLLK